MKYCPIKCWTAREKTIDTNGYVRVKVPEHPCSFRGGWYYEHRLVMEREMGRLLKKYETVHHISEDKQDNSVNNLFVCSRLEHNKAHLTTG